MLLLHVLLLLMHVLIMMHIVLLLLHVLSYCCRMKLLLLLHLLLLHVLLLRITFSSDKRWQKSDRWRQTCVETN